MAEKERERLREVEAAETEKHCETDRATGTEQQRPELTSCR